MKRKLLHLIFLLLTVFAAQAQELYVCTYNVRYKNSSDNDAGNGWATRCSHLINFVNFQQPDLLGVQEAVKAQMNDMLNGLKGYAYIGAGRDDGNTSGEYSAIFYRKERMIPLDHGDFWLSDTPYKPSKGFPSMGGSTTYKRICSWCKFFDKATGTVIYHFNTHLDLDETNRQQSYYLIKQKIEELAGSNYRNVPIIISGDYNAVQTGDAYKLFSGSGFLFDCYARAKQKFITNGTCPGFNSGNYSSVSGELRRIDHIFVTRPFTVEHYGVLNPSYYSTSGSADYHERAFSDHSPVFAKLSLRNSELAVLPTTPPPSIDGVYQLSTPEDLQAFSFIVGGVAGFLQDTAAKAVLTDDIDMESITCWLPIGTEEKPFTGTFDGQGHTIQNISITTGKSYSGLFGSTSGATIKNFHLSGNLVVAEWTGEHGAVGFASGSTVTDVHSELNITASKANSETKHIGGIVGSMSGGTTISRCSFAGKLTDAGTNTIGGIAGYADQTANTISNAINYGTVKSNGAETNTGGILGYVNWEGFQISHCVNVGSIIGSETYAGQIIGRQRAAMTTLPTSLYYLEGKIAPFGTGTDASSATGATPVTTEQLRSGEVTYELNSDQTDINWYQTLATDDYPVLDPTHLRVWFLDETYTNDDPTAITEIVNGISLNGKCYNLAGQRLTKMQKGINIVNGKKIAVK